jgi:hypothetical protein
MSLIVEVNEQSGLYLPGELRDYTNITPVHPDELV